NKPRLAVNNRFQQSEPLIRRPFSGIQLTARQWVALEPASHMAEQTLRDNVANTFACAAMTRMFLIILQIVAVIESDFFSSRDVPLRDDPDSGVLAFGFAVG